MFRNDANTLLLKHLRHEGHARCQPSVFSRRDFLAGTLVSGAAFALSRLPGRSATETQGSSPIAVFSKIYQELKLDFEAAATVTADAGLDGVDCPVRAGGEILPERAADQLPA